MKTSVLPQIRVEPELRASLESVLREGETLSAFVESCVRGAIEYRCTQAEFHARGEAAWKEYQETGESFPASEVTAELREMLETRRRQLEASSSKE